MPKKAAAKKIVRKRRTAADARVAILDAAEIRLVAAGPAGIRLQEVAKDVGVSHPNVLHHFGSREGLVEAVVKRALDSLHASLLAAMTSTSDTDAPAASNAQVESMLAAVSNGLGNGGHGRAFLWLALSGYAPTVEELHVRSVAEAVHEIRRSRRTGKKRMPPFEDTYFTILMPALALLSLSVIDPPSGSKEDGLCSSDRFRTWLAKLIHEHLEQD